MVLVAPEPGLVARRADGRLVVEDFRDGLRLEFTGCCARDIGEAAGGGAAAAAARSRLVALARATRGPARDALMAAAEGRFRPATSEDLLRRDGWDMLWVELTARCNERCVHCYAESSPERTEALSRETVLELVEDAAALRFQMVQFTGGDPLLCPFLVEAARRTRALGLGVEVYTNGLALRPDLLAELAALRSDFAFSLYGDTPEPHDRVTRVPGSHARTSDAIRRAIAAGGRVRVGIILMGENAGRGEATIVYARSLGVREDSIGLDVSHSVGRGAFDPRVQRPPVERGGSGGFHRSRPAEACDETDPRTARRLGRLAVLPDGSVVPCIFTRWAPLGRVGPGRRLRQVLLEARPSAAWAPGDPAACSIVRLQCGECRVAAAGLAALATGATGAESP
ncbi:MAG: radical SAM protein [Planctomycetales bacterium]|nr:radical SAM protein [Planctomycetales bacterium]